MSQPEFISEPITPERGSFDTSLMQQGLAALPGAFVWRGQRYEIVECLEHIKQSTPDMGELYLRRQQFTVRLDTGALAVIYFERNARLGASRERAKQRWFLYTLEEGDGNQE